MSYRAAAAVVLAQLISAVSGLGQTRSPGEVNYQQLDAPYLDQYTKNPGTAVQQWFLSHFMRVASFSPYFDPDTDWYPGGMFYQNSYAIYPGSAVLSEHPEWVLHDQNGNMLYIPWNCNGGTCPSYAGDIANPAFRAWWISSAQQIMNRANYLGIFIDDVNLPMHVSDGNGNLVAPVDLNTGLPMTSTAWATYMAAFMQQIRDSFPNKELTFNAIWYASPSGAPAGFDPLVEAEIKAATNLNVERGVASDTGLTGGTGQFSVYSLFAYVDHVHALGASVTLEEYQVTPAQQQYGLAAYFMISNGSDRIGDSTTTPDNWFPGYNVNLGTPTGPRSYVKGVFRRNFTNGIALLGEPGLPAQTIALPGTFTTLDGALVTSVTISGSQGIILTGLNSQQAQALAPPARVILRSLSMLKPAYQSQSSGTLQTNKSAAGTPIRINGLTYANGLGVSAASEVKYWLWGNCSSFTATVGVDSSVPKGQGNLQFQVWGDDTLLYNSSALSSGSAVGRVKVDLTGYQMLDLVVTGAGGAAPPSANDYGDWANGVVGCSN